MSSIHPERPVLQPVILQGARKINRRARGHGTSLITLPGRHGAPNTAIITEAILERKAAQHYLAQPDVVSVRAQVGPVPYRGLDNAQHTHVFDLLVERGDGRRIAVAVKPYALAVKERLDLKLGCIAQSISPKFADEVTLFTDRTISRATEANNARFHALRKVEDTEADAAVRRFIGTLTGQITLRRLVEVVGLGGRAFRAAFVAVFLGLLVQVSSGVIDYSTVVRAGRPA